MLQEFVGFSVCMWCVLARRWKLNAPRRFPSSWYRTFTATVFAVIGGQFTAATSWRRFVLYLRFWNQIFTWFSVSFNMAAKPARSGPERYFCWLNRRSNSKTCAWENAARDRFLRNFDRAGELGLLTFFGCSVLSRWFDIPVIKIFMIDVFFFCYLLI